MVLPVGQQLTRAPSSAVARAEASGPRFHSLGTENKETQNSLSESPETYAEWKKPVRKGRVPSWKQQDYRTRGQICGCQGLCLGKKLLLQDCLRLCYGCRDPGVKQSQLPNAWWQFHAQGFHKLNPRGQQLCAFRTLASTRFSSGSFQESTAGIYNDKHYHLKPKRVVIGLAEKHYIEFCWEIFFFIQPRSRSNENFTNHSWGYWINSFLVFWRQLWIVNKNKYQAPVPPILQLERRITCKTGGGRISILLLKWNEKCNKCIIQ